MRFHSKGTLGDGEASYPVGNVEVEVKNKKKSMSIMIDGGIFEGVVKFKVTPLKDPVTNEHMTVDVMSFCPVDM